MFCESCGKEISEKAKFCRFCGESVNKDEIVKNEKDLAKREEIYEGKIYKCPNCGFVLDSFVTNCPSCGYELRDVKKTGAVAELSKKLEEIEMSREKTSIWTSNIEQKADKQKISVIRNFPIPNTKEDLYEFLILSSSNVENFAFMHGDVHIQTSKAWRAKFEQAYQKAKILFKDEERMTKIEQMYKSVRKKQDGYGMLIFLFGIVIAFTMIFALTVSFTNPRNNVINENSVKNISAIKSVEENVVNKTNEENVVKQDNGNTSETKKEIQNSIMLADNITVKNNEYIEIKEVGCKKSGNQYTYAVVLLNNSDKAIYFPSYKVTLYSKEKKVLVSEDRVLGFIYPRQKIVDDCSVHSWEEPDKIEVVMVNSKKEDVKEFGETKKPEYEELKCENISVNKSNITGEVYNPNNYSIDSAKVMIIFKDEDNKIVDSRSGFIDNIPAKGKVPFDIFQFPDTQVTNKVEVTAYSH